LNRCLLQVAGSLVIMDETFRYVVVYFAEMFFSSDDL